MNGSGRAVHLPVEEDELRGHLLIHHSLYTTETSDFAELYGCHEEEHAGPMEPVHPHVHTEPAPQDEWSWE